MRKKEILITLSTIAFLSLVLGHFCYAKEPQKLSDVKMPEFIRMKGGTDPGTPNDLIARVVLRNIQEVFPKVTTRYIPGGAEDAVVRIEKGEADLAASDPTHLYDSWFGIKKYEGRQAKKVRFLANAATTSQVLCVVKDDSKIYGLKDLGNKRVCFGLPTFSYITHLKPALALHGLTYENISVKGGLLYWGKFTDALEMLAAGQLDAVFAYGGQPVSAVQTLSMTRKIRIIPWTKEELDAAFQTPTPGYGPRTLLAGTYKGQDKDIQVIGYWNAISVSSDLPDDVVYNICWAI